MKRLRKFLSLPSGDRRLLISAVSLLAVSKASFWMVRLQTVPSLLARVTRLVVRREGDPPSPDRIVWAVELASRYVPAATCLVQALTVQTLLARHGHTGLLQIGVGISQSRV